MTLMKTDKEVLNDEEILSIISKYEQEIVPNLKKLWDYYIAKNPPILARKNVDANNPDNRIIVPYGRKIVNTFTGYAYRPRYITYKANIEKNDSLEVDENNNPIVKPLTQEEQFIKQLQTTFNENNEHIKTSRAGRNMAIYGVSYEIVYVDAKIDPNNTEFPVSAEPKFFSVDPKELILLYDMSSEPKKKIAIRFYPISDIWYKVEVYYNNKVKLYDRKRSSQDMSKWELTFDKEYPNWFGEIPIVAYYFGDEMLGVIEPVRSLIDANDVLYSDSMNEFDRFAYAYLIMKKFGITDASKMKTPGVVSEALSNLKKKRVFEHLPSDAEIKFLTKDIPTGFIDFMANKIREQIHIQSHVPDFTSDKMAGASGIAIQRLLFDFENMVSSTEADFDLGLLDRIKLINIIYIKTGKPNGTWDMVTISHKRNMPLNLKEFAETALTMKSAGFSSYLICDIMPDDIIPDIQAELLRQKKEAEALVGNSFDNDLGLEDNESSEEDLENEEGNL